MSLPLSARPVLWGALLGASAGALAAWLEPGPPGLVPAAALLGGGVGWLVDRRFRRPLRRLAERLDGAGTAGPRAAAIERAVSRLEGRLEEAELERRTLWKVLESMADGVVVVDARGRVELINQAFGTLFDAADPRPGQTVLELSRSPALAGFVDRLRAADGVAGERIEAAAGRTLEVRGRRLADERRVVVARDRSEQLRLDETRRALVANVSHELRTPLTAIRGYAENLRDGAMQDPPTADRFLDRILAQCGRLEALLEDLLALSRLERDKPVVLDSGLDLARLIERALETVRVLAAERQVDLRFTPSPVPPIVGNVESLERLLLNLLENAIKYNRPGGGVNVDLLLEGGQVVVAVADDGIGVPAADLPRIFERFYRVDAGRSREEGGTGLGLAIVKHAARLHGGRIEVSSKLGRGSEFRVHLPIGATRG